MTLKEWASIPVEKQRALVVEQANNEDWRALHRDLAEQAARSLKNYLCGNRYVSNVQYAIGEVYKHEPAELILNVCTKDSDPPHLELPKRFEGFRVCQFDYGPLRDAYLKTWKRLSKN
jgi:hypothetical protein